MSLGRLELGLVLSVGLDVSMRQGMAVLRIRLVDMLRRDGGGHHPGRESENQGEMPD